MATDPATQPFDRDGRVHGVLAAIVRDYGTAVLSNPVMLANLCADEGLDQDARRETNLIVDAARDNVSALLDQQVKAVGPRAAMQLTAVTLAEQRSLDREAASWVVGEFAAVMGFDPSSAAQAPGLDTTIPPALHEDHGRGQLQDRQVQDRQRQDEQLEDRRLQERQPEGRQPERQRQDEAAAPHNGEHEDDGRRPRPVWPRALGVGIALAVVGAALVLGLVLPSVLSGRSANQQLQSLIEPSVKAGGACITDKSSEFVYPKQDVGAQADCAPPPPSAVSLVRYVLASNGSGLAAVYNDYVSSTANTSFNHGDCGDFSTFNPQCETSYYYGNNKTTLGRVVEYYHNSDPVLVFTVSSKNVLIVLLGSHGAKGDGVAQYFRDHGHELLVTTS